MTFGFRTVSRRLKIKLLDDPAQPGEMAAHRLRGNGFCRSERAGSAGKVSWLGTWHGVTKVVQACSSGGKLAWCLIMQVQSGLWWGSDERVRSSCPSCGSRC